MSAAADAGAPPPGLRLSLPRLQRGSLWLLAFSGGFVFFEPSPYEVMFALTALIFAFTGLRFNSRLAPLVVLLVGFNLGGALALIPFIEERASVMFVGISIYLMFTTVFFAVLMAEDALARLEVIRSGYTAAALVASLAGILGYFGVAGLGEHFSLYNRASGTFKDPNVLGPFLVLPIVYILQAVIVGRMGPAKATLLSIPLALALFLTFSRGAWGHLVGSMALFMLLTFMTSRNHSERARIVLITIGSVAALALMLAIALSVETIRTVFELRASLDQAYDLGVTGRFGSQLRSIPLLLEQPFGFGPLKFRLYFPEDPHNVYVNAFASYGWLGGVSYAALILMTWVVGWRTVFIRGPYQGHAIAVWSALCIVTIQGFQIDTDHWRHVFLLLGLMWGLAVLSVRDHRTARRAGIPPEPGPRSWPSSI